MKIVLEVLGVLVAIAVSAVCWDSDAGCPKIVASHGAAVLAVPVNPYATSTYGAAVGTSVQAEAVTTASEERIADRVVAKLKAAGVVPGGGSVQASGGDGPLSIAEEKCVRCHSRNGAQPMAKAIEWVDLTDLYAVDAETRLDMIASVIDGRMPKGGKMTAQELGDFVGQLAGARSAPGYVAPVESQGEEAPEPPAVEPGT